MASASNTSAIYRERMEKTVVVTLPPEGKPYMRPEVVNLVVNTVGNSSVEAIGQRERNLQWEITFKSVELKNKFLSKENLEIKGHPVRISGIRRSTIRMRVFYVPFYVPTTVITQQLEKVGATVVNAFTEKDKEANCNTNVRNIVVECDNPEVIPDRMTWEFDGLKGQALINVSGRPPRCLRCNERGHKKFQCVAPYCKACRKVGHEESHLCRNLKPSFAAVTVALRDTKRDHEEEDIDEAPVDDEVPLLATAPTMIPMEETDSSFPPEIADVGCTDNQAELSVDDFPPLPQSPVKPAANLPLLPRTDNEMSVNADKEMEVDWSQSKINKRKLKENTPKQTGSDPTSVRKKTCPVLVTSTRQLSKKDDQVHSKTSSTDGRGKIGTTHI